LAPDSTSGKSEPFRRGAVIKEYGHPAAFPILNFWILCQPSENAGIFLIGPFHPFAVDFSGAMPIRMSQLNDFINNAQVPAVMDNALSRFIPGIDFDPKINIGLNDIVLGKDGFLMGGQDRIMSKKIWHHPKNDHDF
jgi:hypothetical protein